MEDSLERILDMTAYACVAFCAMTIALWVRSTPVEHRTPHPLGIPLDVSFTFADEILRIGYVGESSNHTEPRSGELSCPLWQAVFLLSAIPAARLWFAGRRDSDRLQELR